VSRKATEAPRQRPGTTYAVVVALAMILGTVAMIVIDVLTVDFIGTNPHRPPGNALAIALIQGPLVGLMFVVLAGALGIAVSGVSAAIVHRRIGRVPLWTLPIISFLCWGAVILQARFINAYFLPPNYDHAAVMTFGSRLLRLAAGYLYLLTAMWVAWWLTRPRRLPALTAAP